MSPCRRIALLLDAWVDGQASPGEARAVEEHLGACAACRGAAERLRLAGALVSRVEMPLPADLRDAVFARLEAEGLLARRRGLFAFSVRWLAVPAAAAAAAALFLVARGPERGAAPPAGGLRPVQMMAKGEAAPAGAVRPPDEAGRPAGEAGAGGAATKGALEGGARGGAARVGPVAQGRAPAAARAGAGEEGPGAVVPAADREVIAWLDLLEDPMAFDEGGDFDDLELLAVPETDRG